MVRKTEGISGGQPPKKAAPVKTTKSEGGLVVPVGQSYKQELKETPPYQSYDPDKFKTYEEYKQKRAQYYYNNDLKTGKLEFNEPTKVFGKEIFAGSYTYHTGLNDNGKPETLGNIKYRFNLPDGSLRSQSSGGGGDFDLHKAASTIRISIDAMKKGVEKQK